MNQLYCVHCYPRKVPAEYISQASLCEDHFAQSKATIKAYTDSMVENLNKQLSRPHMRPPHITHLLSVD